MMELREETFFGTDIVPSVVRFAAMNLYLHDIGGKAESLIREDVSLRSKPSVLVDIVLNALKLNALKLYL